MRLGGTLFLDEIGAMPSEVQVLLLRFLEDHEVRSLGDQRAETVRNLDLQGGSQRSEG